MRALSGTLTNGQLRALLREAGPLSSATFDAAPATQVQRCGSSNPGCGCLGSTEASGLEDDPISIGHLINTAGPGTRFVQRLQASAGNDALAQLLRPRPASMTTTAQTSPPSGGPSRIRHQWTGDRPPEVQSEAGSAASPPRGGTVGASSPLPSPGLARAATSPGLPSLPPSRSPLPGPGDASQVAAGIESELPPAVSQPTNSPAAGGAGTTSDPIAALTALASAASELAPASVSASLANISAGAEGAAAEQRTGLQTRPIRRLRPVGDPLTRSSGQRQPHRQQRGSKRVDPVRAPRAPPVALPPARTPDPVTSIRQSPVVAVSGNQPREAAQQAEIAKAAISGMPTTDAGLRVPPAPPATLELTGDADPEVLREQHAP